ncbi:enolase C-terminal domain-like protein [Didymella exigua CBS 183.55]|uniref:Enolase C-terminal domain-like protein n=1 Tax=Didymella exigua CBS 183.55 TaxID=1150837 RepID=A0A6A5RP82_9PLEO|nr:enolase C-terminal domain-like protein [Didymella exigua CBS 183.55]KAF1928096.1 enolase C-terminal domain-like protein [Didymella exigua CBS 183.55]
MFVDSDSNQQQIDPVITGFKTRDVRFPTSLDQTGSDAMNDVGDYSAAFCVLETSSGHAGHGMTFTIGRGNGLVVQAIPYFASALVGHNLSSLVKNFAATWKALTRDCQVRWVGPEKGVTHLAFGAVINAIWDLWAKCANKPVWKLVADLSPEEFVRCVPFDYIEDAITPEEAIRLLTQVSGQEKEQRIRDAYDDRAVPIYTTSAGWLGYSDEKMCQLLDENRRAGVKHFKFKVGRDLQEDRKRLRLAREIIGYDTAKFMIDANQVWSVPQAISYFIEEPTSPDDILGHATIQRNLKGLGIGVATGEMCQNRVVFKQLLQAEAIDICQVDACRMGGLNEVLAVLLMAAKFGVQVVPHSGGVGLPELTQHLSLIDYVCVSGKVSLLEYVDHLHEHFRHPSMTKDGYLISPRESGYSVEMVAESMDKYTYPSLDKKGWWVSDEARKVLDRQAINFPQV